MEFGTSIHCMDGRIQEPIMEFLKKLMEPKLHHAQYRLAKL